MFHDIKTFFVSKSFAAKAKLRKCKQHKARDEMQAYLFYIPFDIRILNLAKLNFDP